VYSLREGRTSKNYIDRRTRYSHQSIDGDTFSARERESREKKERSKAACSAEGIRITIQFIHSRPSFNYSFCLYPPLFLRTPSTFRQPTTTTNHHHHYAPSLAHNHSTFMEMCVMPVRLSIRTQTQTNKRGLV